MNNTFNITRFGKVVARDFRKYIDSFGLTLVILIGLTLVLWLLTLIFGFTMPTLVRWIVIYIAVVLALILVPARAFGDINLPREGVRFAMLPASNLEKYLSYILFCLLTPVAVLLLSWGLDSLLTLLPFGGFSSHIKSYGIYGIMQDFFQELDLESSMDADNYREFSDYMSAINPYHVTSTIVGLFFNCGLFMFGNLLFQRHKTIKTFGCLIGISYVLSMLAQLFVIGPVFSKFVENPDAMNFAMATEVTTHTTMFSMIVHIVLTLGLFIGMYYKLKTQKY